jgi:ribosomal protein S18 acetylase RimI-like enzyme
MGRLLVDCALSHAFSLGFAEIELKVSEDNTAATTLYQELGFYVRNTVAGVTTMYKTRP